MRILIADDNDYIRLLFTTILQSNLRDVQLETAENGAKAVDAFRNCNFDIVIMDIFMPVKDGYQAAVEIQELCRIKNLRSPFIVFCTGFSASEEVQILLEDKEHYCLLKKPATIDQIIEAIEGGRGRSL